MTAPAIAPHTAAMIARVASTGLPTGDARKPAGAGWEGPPGQSRFVAYFVVYPLDMARAGPDASLADRLSDPQLRYQVTSVGEDRRGAEAAADLAAARLLNGAPLDIPGRTAVLLTHEVSAGVERDESVNPPLYYAVDRYRLDTN
jgi:hypothetical protein